MTKYIDEALATSQWRSHKNISGVLCQQSDFVCITDLTFVF